MTTKNELEVTIKALKLELKNEKAKPPEALIKDTVVNMSLEADGATKTLAKALLAQAQANAASCLAMGELAKTLKPIDVCAIRVSTGTDT